MVPDNFADLYNLPVQVLNSIRQNLTQKAVPVRMQGPANVSLFIYDNNTFIVESFSDEDVDITVLCQSEGLKDLLSGDEVSGSRVMSWGRSTSNERSFRVHLKPHSYRVFKF